MINVKYAKRAPPPGKRADTAQSHAKKISTQSNFSINFDPLSLPCKFLKFSGPTSVHIAPPAALQQLLCRHTTLSAYTPKSEYLRVSSCCRLWCMQISTLVLAVRVFGSNGASWLVWRKSDSVRLTVTT